MANVLKDNNGNIVNCVIPRYEPIILSVAPSQNMDFDTTKKSVILNKVRNNINADNKLILENGKVKIGKGVKTIKIDCQFFISDLKSNTKNIEILKNNAIVGWGRFGSNGEWYGSVIFINGLILDVNENDIISAQVYTASGAGTLSSTTTDVINFFTIEKIK